MFNNSPSNYFCAGKNVKMEVDEIQKPETVQARFVSDTGEEAGPPLELPTAVTVSQLGRICNAVLQNVRFISNQIKFILNFISSFSGRTVNLFIFHRSKRSRTGT